MVCDVVLEGQGIPQWARNGLRHLRTVCRPDVQALPQGAQKVEYVDQVGVLMGVHHLLGYLHLVILDADVLSAGGAPIQSWQITA